MGLGRPSDMGWDAGAPDGGSGPQRDIRPGTSAAGVSGESLAASTSQRAGAGQDGVPRSPGGAVERVVHVPRLSATVAASPAMAAAIANVSATPPVSIALAADAPDDDQAWFRAFRERVGDRTCARWIDGRARIDLERGQVVITAATRFAAEQINRRFAAELAEAVEACGVLPPGVRAVVRTRVSEVLDTAAGRGDTSVGEARRRPGAARRGDEVGREVNGHEPATVGDEARATRAPGREGGLSDGSDSGRVGNAEPGPSRRAWGAGTESGKASAGAWARGAAVGPDLDDFVVGEANRLAYEAAVRVAEQRADHAYSPLFLHGGCGLGKTHLLRGIARRFAGLSPGRALYITMDSFTNEFVASVKNNTMDGFRSRFRKVGLLCIDDVHFVGPREKTQAELLHTLDELDLKGSFIVLASDAPPQRIEKLNDALVSRFTSGAMAQLRAPEPALVAAMAMAMARRRALPLTEAAARLFADVSEDRSRRGQVLSARDLEGLLTQVAAVWGMDRHAASEDGLIGPAVVEHALHVCGQAGASSPRAMARSVTLGSLIEHTCAALDVQREDLGGKGRHRRVVLARAVVVVLARRLTTHSFPEIARALGRPNHSTVVTAFQRLGQQMAAGEPVDAGCEHDGSALADLIDRVERRVRLAGAA